jgi:hypothetical protein
LSQTRENENLFFYLGVTNLALSFVLVREDKWIQHPVYYFRYILYDDKTIYLKVEKIALALVSAFRKLKPYFQACQVIILTNQPLWQILCKPEMFKHLARWTIKLREYSLQYKPRRDIKGQALKYLLLNALLKVL